MRRYGTFSPSRSGRCRLVLFSPSSSLPPTWTWTRPTTRPQPEPSSSRPVRPPRLVPRARLTLTAVALGTMLVEFAWLMRDEIKLIWPYVLLSPVPCGHERLSSRIRSTWHARIYMCFRYLGLISQMCVRSPSHASAARLTCADSTSTFLSACISVYIPPPPGVASGLRTSPSSPSPFFIVSKASSCIAVRLPRPFPPHAPHDTCV